MKLLSVAGVSPDSLRAFNRLQNATAQGMSFPLQGALNGVGADTFKPSALKTDRVQFSSTTASEAPTAEAILETTTKADRFGSFVEEIPLLELANKTIQQPSLAWDPHQKLWYMVRSQGVRTVHRNGEELPSYNFFAAPKDSARPVRRMEDTIATVAEALKAAAYDEKAKKTLTVIWGPRGSGKTMIVERLIGGFVNFAQDDRFATYTLAYANLPDEIVKRHKLESTPYFDADHKRYMSPYGINALYGLPLNTRTKLEGVLQEVQGKHPLKSDDGETFNYPIKLTAGFQRMSSPMDVIHEDLRRYYKQRSVPDDKIEATILKEHARAVRYIPNESARRGIARVIGLERNDVDVRELVGSANFAHEHSVFHYNYTQGAYFAAALGLLGIEEILKFERPHLLPILQLGGSREVKPTSGLPMNPVEAVIVGTTNPPEKGDREKDATLRATLSRMRFVASPYITEIDGVKEILDDTFVPTAKGMGVHINPNVTDTVSLLSVASSLSPPSDKSVFGPDTKPARVLIQKAYAYNGKHVKGVTNAQIREMRRDGNAKGEGMDGIAPRDLENITTAWLASEKVNRNKSVDSVGYLDFMDQLVKGEVRLESPMTEETDRRLKDLIPAVREEAETKIVEDVTEAVNQDPSTGLDNATRFALNYRAFVANEDTWSDQELTDGEPVNVDELFMRRVEAYLGHRFSDDDTDDKKLVAAPLPEQVRQLRIKTVASWTATLRDASNQGYGQMVMEDTAFREAIARVIGDATKAKVNPLSLKLNPRTTDEREAIDTLKARLKAKGYDDYGAQRAFEIWQKAKKPAN